METLLCKRCPQSTHNFQELGALLGVWEAGLEKREPGTRVVWLGGSLTSILSAYL